MKTAFAVITFFSLTVAFARDDSGTPVLSLAAAGAMPVAGWLEALALGAFAGAIGQLVRAIAGLAKMTRRSESDGQLEGFQASKLVISLLVGATAGTLAALGLLVDGKPPNVSTILGLMAAGYAGADFIEGFAGKHFQGTPNDVFDALAKAKDEITASAVASAQAAIAATGTQLTVSQGGVLGGQVVGATPATVPASGVSVNIATGPAESSTAAPVKADEAVG